MPTRKRFRLKIHDYSLPGYYFVTICTHKRVCLFGKIHHGEMQLNELGEIIKHTWLGLPNHYANAVLDAYTVMPNHFHGIVFIMHRADSPVVYGPVRPIVYGPVSNRPLLHKKQHALPEIIRGFKTFSSRKINEIRTMPNIPVWQRGYFDRIIRSERELLEIRQYIQNNPKNWAMDVPFL